MSTVIPPRGNITVRTMPRVFVSKSGSRPVPHNNALLERHGAIPGTQAGPRTDRLFCKGTVLKRMMKCGKAQCACASDATKRHGPYFELTYNIRPPAKRSTSNSHQKRLRCIGGRLCNTAG